MSDGHNCLDAPRGEQHCITCHQQGHTYVAHLGILGLAPRIDTGALVDVTPGTSTTEGEQQ